MAIGTNMVLCPEFWHCLLWRVSTEPPHSTLKPILVLAFGLICSIKCTKLNIWTKLFQDLMDLSSQFSCKNPCPSASASLKLHLSWRSWQNYQQNYQQAYQWFWNITHQFVHNIHCWTDRYNWMYWNSVFDTLLDPMICLVSCSLWSEFPEMFEKFLEKCTFLFFCPG